MDVFIEKIVPKKKGREDSLISAGIILGALILMFVVIPIIPFVNSLSIFFDAGIAYLAYYFITSRNIEYEYAVTNGDLDIDKIVSRRKRKRVFSANCKDFEVVAKVKSTHFTHDMQNIKNRIEAVSSMDLPDIYFTVALYKGERTIVFFEPDERMLEAFKTFIPRKLFA